MDRLWTSNFQTQDSYFGFLKKKLRNWTNVGQILEVDRHWIKYGFRPTTNHWTNIEHALDIFWTKIGHKLSIPNCPVMAHSRPRHGPLQAQSWPTQGPDMAHSRPSHGQLKAQMWPTLGPVTAHPRPSNGSLKAPVTAQTWPIQLVPEIKKLGN